MVAKIVYISRFAMLYKIPKRLTVCIRFRVRILRLILAFRRLESDYQRLMPRLYDLVLLPRTVRPSAILNRVLETASGSN